ncbi:CHU large protein [Nonlabens dokdonensis DSW-6]|uniref:CHU large protein n=2 Tax=Nonlabens dokdonensis TaxID=328515 RepID=L7W7H8_NONDD|nr:CHU large protein [Nonlabens dokdonensis DSW-6]
MEFINLPLFRLVVLALLITSCKNNQNEQELESGIVDNCWDIADSSSTDNRENGDFTAPFTSIPVQIDGCGKDQIWEASSWYGMNYLWMGEKVNTTDYQGKFKLAWDENYLYLLVMVEDDTLHPTLQDGIENYWKGDYVEVFIDEDKSGGDHKFNHQAFAYHISTEGHAIDQSTQQKPIFLDDHINVSRAQKGNTYLWEIAIQLYDKDFDDQDLSNNEPIKLTAQKEIGFSIAYGDNDGNNLRENFMGSKKNHGTNNDDGYINSDVFGSLLLIK